MRLTSLIGIAGMCALMPGCLLYVNVDEDGEDFSWHQDRGDDETGDPVASDTADPSDDHDLTIHVSVDPFEVVAGESTIVTATVEGDALADELEDIRFVGEDVKVLDFVLRGGAEVVIAIEVDADASGAVDIVLDFGAVGVVVVPAVIEVVDAAADPGAPDPADPHTPGGEDCP